MTTIASRRLAVARLAAVLAVAGLLLGFCDIKPEPPYNQRFGMSATRTLDSSASVAVSCCHGS